MLFAPDFVVSAGGIINLAEEFTGYDRERALARAAGIGPTLERVLAAVAERGVTPQRAAEDLADERVRDRGRGAALASRRPRRLDRRPPAHPTPAAQSRADVARPARAISRGDASGVG